MATDRDDSVPTAELGVAAERRRGSDVPLDERLQSEQLRLITTQVGRLPLFLLTIDIFIAWMIWRAGDAIPAAIWLLLAVSYDVWRYWLCARERKTPSRPALPKLRLVSYAFVGAALWRIAPIPILFSPASIDLQVMFTMVCVGLAAGGVATAGGVFWAYGAWAAIVGGSLAVAWALQGGFDRFGIGVLVAMMFATLTLYARDQGKTLRRLMELVYANESLAVSLRAERDRAELASQSKTRFFAAASHDLRQPLHALSINATTLELVAQRQTESLIRELSSSITRALRQSNELLDMLLDISQLDAQVVETRYEAIDAIALLTGLRDEFSPTAAQRGLTLDVSVPAQSSARIHTDERQVRRLLGNLVSNALKFTLEGGVTLELVPGADPDYVVVAVVDTGPGIPVDEQERVFEDFYQLGNPSRNRAMGLGLGLSIVRRTAALLGAKVRLHSAPGQGCRFEVLLPRLRADAQATAPRSVDTLTPAQLRDNLSEFDPRVLAIDDEREILDSLAILLPLFGCDVRCAEDLATAEEALDRGFEPNLLIVDYHLRNTSGTRVISDLRTRCGPIPAIIVTGDTLPASVPLEERVRIVHKPIDGQLLAHEMLLALRSPSAVERSDVRPAPTIA